MILKSLIYVEEECNENLLNGVGLPVYCLPELSMQAIAEKGLSGEKLLVIASRDATIMAAQELNLAVAAYRNPHYPGETYAGVGMVIEGFEEVDRVFLERIYERCHGIPWEIARTDRFVIREFSMPDLNALFELYQNPGITDFVEPLYEKEEERRFQEAYIANMYGYYGYGMWLVTDTVTGEVIGRAGLEHREFAEGTELEMGYIIAPKYQRQGIATEVCKAIMDFAERELDFPRVNALTDSRNKASIALLKKLGFHCVGDTDVTGSLLQRYEYPLHHKNRQRY